MRRNIQAMIALLVTECDGRINLNVRQDVNGKWRVRLRDEHAPDAPLFDAVLGIEELAAKGDTLDEALDYLDALCQVS